MSVPVTDRPALPISGYPALVAVIALAVAGCYLAFPPVGAFLSIPDAESRGVVPPHVDIASLGFGAFLLVAAIVVLCGVYVLQPNESVVMTFLGAYRGTELRTGLRWANPFNRKQKVSRRMENLHIPAIKVNDASGNPIEIGAAIVWHVADSAKAAFDVNDYTQFVEQQSEVAMRNVAVRYPYDNWTDADEADPKDGDPVKPEIVSLRSGGDHITEELRNELRTRIARAGIEIVDARVTHLAYAPEIAHAMLRRQQAAAVVAAKKTLVRGAVDLVKEALQRLSDNNIEIEGERKAAMISNLLVVLVGDKDASPIINAGTLYG